MLMGIASNTNAGKTWSCWDNFKLYFEGSAFDAFSVKISKLETLRDSLETLGIASASELTALVEQYGSYNETLRRRKSPPHPLSSKKTQPQL